MYGDVKLVKDEEKRFLYEHISDESFRLLTLHQSGEIVIKVNVYKDIKEYLDEKTTKEKFTWTGRDFLRI